MNDYEVCFQCQKLIPMPHPMQNVSYGAPRNYARVAGKIMCLPCLEMIKRENGVAEPVSLAADMEKK